MTEAQRETIAGLLRKANGRRTTRLLAMPEIERCMESALGSELGFAWASAGDAPDARAVTSVCLAVVAGDQLTLGVAPAHGSVPRFGERCPLPRLGGQTPRRSRLVVAWNPRDSHRGHFGRAARGRDGRP